MRPATKKRIKELGYKGYTAYCRSPVWLAVRKSYFSRHPKICWICGSDKKIHLHHACYDRLGGQELDSDLVPLCQAHHRGLHTWDEASSSQARSGAPALQGASRL
jgi:5-methylcytosine-specific restriction endonuclease McrA